MGAFAVSAAVIHEFHNGDVALGVAANIGKAIIENRVSIRRNKVYVGCGLCLCLALTKHFNGFENGFWVFQ